MLHASFVDFADFRSIFGAAAKPSSFQSAEVAATPQRTWLRLVHRRHELRRWVAPRPTFTPHPGLFTHPYHTFLESIASVVPFIRSVSAQGKKAWLRELLEPVRLAHFPSLNLYLPPLDDAFSSGSAALLRATSRDHAQHKEVVVYRSPPRVLVFNLVEHGRRWYRVLTFCSRADCSLASLRNLPSYAEPVPVLACGDAMAQVAAAESLVITRHVTSSLVGLPPVVRAPVANGPGNSCADSQHKPQDKGAGWGDYGGFLSRRFAGNAHGSTTLTQPVASPAIAPNLTVQQTHSTIEQTYVPSRLLHGLLPEVLLETHLFWQNEDDTLTGYPKASAALDQTSHPTLILVVLSPELTASIDAHATPSNPGSKDANTSDFPATRAALHTACIRRRRLRPRGRASPPANPAIACNPMASPTGIAPMSDWSEAPTDATLAYDETWEEAVEQSDGVEDEILINLLHPELDEMTHALAMILRRLDDPSHILAWARRRRPAETAPADDLHDRTAGVAGASSTSSDLDDGGWALASVELPRLRLAFEVKRSSGGTGGVTRLYCREHASMFISSVTAINQTSEGSIDLDGGHARGRAGAVRQLLGCLPHAVVLEDEQGELAVLVSAAAKPYSKNTTAPADQSPRATNPNGRDESYHIRRDAGTCLLERNDLAWLAALTQARHYLYPIHPSNRVLCSRTLASSLYLLLLHFAHRRYDQVTHPATC